MTAPSVILHSLICGTILNACCSVDTTIVFVARRGKSIFAAAIAGRKLLAGMFARSLS